MLLQNRMLSFKIYILVQNVETFFINKVPFKLYFVGKRRCNKKCHCDTDQCCHVNGSGDIKLTGSDTMVLRRDVCIFIHKRRQLGMGKRQCVVKWMQDVTYSFEYTSTDFNRKGECVMVLFEVHAANSVTQKTALQTLDVDSNEMRIVFIIVPGVELPFIRVSPVPNQGASGRGFEVAYFPVKGKFDYELNLKAIFLMIKYPRPHAFSYYLRKSGAKFNNELDEKVPGMIRE